MFGFYRSSGVRIYVTHFVVGTGDPYDLLGVYFYLSRAVKPDVLEAFFTRQEIVSPVTS